MLVSFLKNIPYKQTLLVLLGTDLIPDLSYWQIFADIRLRLPHSEEQAAHVDHTSPTISSVRLV